MAHLPGQGGANPDRFANNGGPGQSPGVDIDGLRDSDGNVREVTEELRGMLAADSEEFYANLLRVKAANARNLGILDAMYQQRWLDSHVVSGYSHFRGAGVGWGTGRMASAALPSPVLAATSVHVLP